MKYHCTNLGIVGNRSKSRARLATAQNEERPCSDGLEERKAVEEISKEIEHCKKWHWFVQYNNNKANVKHNRSLLI